MKLHDLRPAPGSHTRKTRVGRGIAAGKGKTAGRGTKGQKARAGGSIPPWFEGGQTPLHMRIPKLRGFNNRFKVYYEVVNVGAIAAAAERGAFESGDMPGTAKGKKAAPLTVNQDVLRAVGLVRTMTKPLKILGAGELDRSTGRIEEGRRPCRPRAGNGRRRRGDRSGVSREGGQARQVSEGVPNGRRRVRRDDGRRRHGGGRERRRRNGRRRD